MKIQRVQTNLLPRVRFTRILIADQPWRALRVAAFVAGIDVPTLMGRLVEQHVAAAGYGVAKREAPPVRGGRVVRKRKHS